MFCLCLLWDCFLIEEIYVYGMIYFGVKEELLIVLKCMVYLFEFL